MNIKNNILFKKKELLNFCTLRFIFGISYSFMIPIIPLYFSSIGISTIIIGIVMSLYGVGKALTQIPFGVVSDWIGDKLLLIIALGLMAFVPIVYIITSNNIFAEGNYIVQGAVLGIAAPATFSILSRSLEPSKRGECTGYASAVFTLGGGIGAIIGGFVAYKLNSYNTVFALASAGIFLSLIFLIFKIRKPERFMKECKKEDKKVSCRSSVIFNEIKKHKLFPRIILLGSIALLGDFIYGCVVSIFPFYGQEVLHGTDFYTSCIISIYLFVFGLFAPVGGVSSDKIGVKKQLFLSFMVMNISLLALSMIRGKILFTGVIILYFLGATFLNAALQNSLLEFGENEKIKGIVFGFVGASESAGYAISPIIAAYIYELNKEMLFIGLLCMSLLVTFIFIVLRKKAFDNKEEFSN